MLQVFLVAFVEFFSAKVTVSCRLHPSGINFHTLLLDRAELTSITPPDATPDETPAFIGHTHTHTRCHKNMRSKTV